jgi:hypothetical protein
MPKRIAAVHMSGRTFVKELVLCLQRISCTGPFAELERERHYSTPAFSACLFELGTDVHSSNAAMAFAAKATVSWHATLSPRALQPPTASICDRAARTLTSAACGEPLSAMTAATLNELPNEVSTQFGQAEPACARAVNNIVTSAAAHQVQRRTRWRRGFISAASTRESEPEPCRKHAHGSGREANPEFALR